jgi:hypothetical protein
MNFVIDKERNLFSTTEVLIRLILVSLLIFNVTTKWKEMNMELLNYRKGKMEE